MNIEICNTYVYKQAEVEAGFYRCKPQYFIMDFLV